MDERLLLCDVNTLSLSHAPRRVVVLLVDADGLSPAVPLVVIEQPTVLGARHVVMSVRLDCGSCGGGGDQES